MKQTPSARGVALDNIKVAIEEYLAAVDGELKGATIREVEVAA